MTFFVGLHQPSDARHFDACFISINRLRNRKSDFKVEDWILDSGAFSTILTHGGYPHPVEEYADQIRRWKSNGNLLAAVSQDYMCEPAMLAKTGLTIGMPTDRGTERSTITYFYSKDFRKEQFNDVDLRRKRQ